MIRVLLADDHALVRAGIRTLVQGIGNTEVIGEAGNGNEVLALVDMHRPDVVLMDIAMPGMNGLEATAAIKQRHPDTHIVILSMYINEAYVEQALYAGASAYLLKDTEAADMERALETVMRNEIYLDPRVSKQLVQSFLKRSPAITESPVAGESQAVQAPASPPAEDFRLTARQREVLRMLAQGRNTKEIAASLGISHKTVETHRAQIMERLDIYDVPGLVRYAIRTGLVQLD